MLQASENDEVGPQQPPRTLAKAGRTSRVDGNDDVSLLGKDFVPSLRICSFLPYEEQQRTVQVPPVRPRVLPSALRTTMYRQQDRPFLLLALLESRRLQQPPMHLLPLRALEPEVAALVQALALEPARREARELLELVLAALVEAAEREDVVRARERRAREDEATVRERLDRRRRAGRRDLAGVAELRGEGGVARGAGRRLGNREGEDLDARVVVGGDEDGLVVMRELLREM